MQKFECPLCKSIISENKFNEVVKIWDSKRKFAEEQKKQLELLKTQRAKMAKDVEELKEKAEKDKYIAVLKAKQEAKKNGIKEGIQTQMKRSEVARKKLQQSLKEIELKNQQIKSLKEQINKGTTPQIEGLELEKKLFEELKKHFPNDEILHLKNIGDVFHKIKYDNQEIGSILYECKKTAKYSKDFIKQIKQDMATRNATYGVLLTYNFDKESSGFKTDQDIIIVHPYGAIYIAEFLRKKLIEIHSLKLSKEELSERAKKLWDYIKSDKFKNNVKDNIHRTKVLMELLEREKAAHEKIWEARNEHYNKIHENTSSIEKESSIILKENENSGVISQIEVIPVKKKLAEQLL